jgi:hypothetical protein
MLPTARGIGTETLCFMALNRAASYALAVVNGAGCMRGSGSPKKRYYNL